MSVSHKPVFSSHIKSIGYDDASGELHVAYENGKTSIHQGVPPGVAAKVMNAPSVGQALHTHIRGQFSHRYLEG